MGGDNGVRGVSVFGGGDGRQQLMAPVGDKVKKIQKFFFQLSKKAPKNVFCFFPHLGAGWVVLKQMWINPHFF